MSSATLPPQLRAYLDDPALAAVWQRVRDRLERNRLLASGNVEVELDDVAASRLGGLLGATLPTGRYRLGLDRLDAALRGSAAAAGLVSVLAELGGPLLDRAARREGQQAYRDGLWGRLDAALAAARLAGQEWVPGFVAGLRRSGLLTRASEQQVTDSLTPAVTVTAAVLAGSAAEPQWELAELAARYTGDAHGLDDGRLAGAIAARALAAATGQPVPSSAAERRALWASVGVTADEVSGSVLTWRLRPAGEDAWAAMMRDRADLGLVTHLSLQELRAARIETMPVQAPRVFACENPQVLQAAARAGLRATLVCFSGNPAAAGLALLRALVHGGADVGYHGDFDWPGVAIAGRLYGRGARPWRMGAADYRRALEDAPAEARLPLSGAATATPWDRQLAAQMAATGVAVHEESLLAVLLDDLG